MRAENMRMVALPAVGAAALGGLVWLSGTPLSNASSSTDDVRLTGDPSSAVLTVDALAPGESVSRTITVDNPASAQSRLSMVEHGAPATFADGQLQLVITRDDQRVYAGQFGAMSDLEMDQGWIPAGGHATFTFTVSLPESAAYVAPGTQTATATYVFESVP